MIQTIVIFTCVLVALIIVHEFGHFIVAKLTGVKVEKFAIGFGKEIFGKDTGGTRYSVNLIPLGGYVKLLGEHRSDNVDLNVASQAYCIKPLWIRFLIVVAGPGANILFSALVLFLLFYTVGIYGPDKTATANEVVANSPASSAGLMSNDIVVEINNQPIADWEAMVNVIGKSNGQPINVIANRDGELVEFTLTPEIMSSEEALTSSSGYKIGVIKKLKTVFVPADSAWDAATHSCDTCWGISKKIVFSMYQLLTGKGEKDDIGGPVAVAKVTQSSYDKGFPFLLYVVSILGINLALINLLPIPMLDGGRIAGLIIEGLRRGKQMPEQLVIIGNTTGQILLAVIIYIVVFNDFAKVIR